MLHGYVIANIRVINAQQMAKYRKWSAEAVAVYGGEFLVRGGLAAVVGRCGVHAHRGDTLCQLCRSVGVL